MFSQSDIASMGMNMNFPTSLRYGNNKYGSLNLLHIEKKLVKKIKTINLLLNDSTNKSLILITINKY